MLFINTVSALPMSQAISSVARAVSPVLKIMSRMGISAAKEKMLRIADRMLNTTDSTKYFL